MLHVKLNARVITAGDPAPLLEELRNRHAPSAAERVLSAADVRAIALENLSPAVADLLRDEMLAAGGDAALEPDAPGPGRGETDIVLVGTATQFDVLLSRLASSEAAAVGREIALAFDNHARDRFEVRLGSRRLLLGPRPALMGVLNVTPDSFSDGGKFLASPEAVAHAERLVEEGADLIDVGGESTRPGSDPVDEDEELARVLPVIETLASRLDVPLSIDTRHARVAREAVASGACLVNDVTGLLGDPEMPQAVAETGAGAILMHMRGEPKTMQEHPHYDNLMADICRYLRRGMQAAAEAGVSEDRLIVDPGIGFGKTLRHNLGILAKLGQLRTLGRPILVGPSRKRFIGELTGVESPGERVSGTVAACALAVSVGAVVLRVHDVREVRQALAVASAISHVGEMAS